MGMVIKDVKDFTDASAWKEMTSIVKDIETKADCDAQAGTTQFFDDCPTEDNAEEIFKKWLAGRTSGEDTVAPKPSGDTVAPKPSGDTVAPNGDIEAPGSNAAAMGLTLAGVLFILQL